MKSNKLVLGILAHVDAGKTTLSEAILYKTGVLKSPGRVDHGDTCMDTDSQERLRGITIFSKQAVIKNRDRIVTIVDTPGHVDFSAEMERTLQILDYAVLVINGSDGVQSHTMTLWKLLQHYEIPTFIFVNKMDLVSSNQEEIMQDMKSKLSDRICDFSDEEGLQDQLALCSEALLNEFLERGSISPENIAGAVATRNVFPAFFGSALKMEGIDEFLQGIYELMVPRDYPDEFSARVYKISRDQNNSRLTFLKVTGGSVKVKEFVSDKEGSCKYQINQIRIYTGDKFESVNTAEAGSLCAVIGPDNSYAGQGLGLEENIVKPLLSPVLRYRVKPVGSVDVHTFMVNLKKLQEEEPHLRLEFNRKTEEITLNVMGDVEVEILKNHIKERFDVDTEFLQGSIIYKETIEEPVIGSGHFEPLKHFAEVHLLIEPGERGSGINVESSCSLDDLSLNWQRLIFTHIQERNHRGVLTDSELTDLRISIIGGKAHEKHTEGGDFRQATYRALRNGLLKAKSVLLEPYENFEIILPVSQVGRAMSDIKNMGGTMDIPENSGDMATLSGYGPLSALRNYQSQLNSYTRGEGRIFTSFRGYEPAAKQEEIVESIGYDPEADTDFTGDSVFCEKGTGKTVAWYEVDEYMTLKPKDLEKRLNLVLYGDERGETPELSQDGPAVPLGKGNPVTISEEELRAVFNRLYRKDEAGRKKYRGKREITADYSSYKGREKPYDPVAYEKRYLLVDGYNIIFAWEELSKLAETSLEGARDSLIDILCNYQGYRGMTLILVFDAYRVKGNPGSVEKHGGIYVIYTKEAQTADQYIERAVHDMGRKHHVTVATSDNLVQMITWGDGAYRISASGFKKEVEEVQKLIRSEIL